ncbi:MAG: hypothetical protein QXL94_00230 [Candidatus Parvarchaeum sp.]
MNEKINCPKCGKPLSYVLESQEATLYYELYRDGTYKDSSEEGGDVLAYTCPECYLELDMEFVRNHFLSTD